MSKYNEIIERVFSIIIKKMIKKSLLMGFSDDFKLIGSKGKLYNRVENSRVYI